MMKSAPVLLLALIVTACATRSVPPSEGAPAAGPVQTEPTTPAPPDVKASESVSRETSPAIDLPPLPQIDEGADKMGRLRFVDLPGWADGDQRQAFLAFLHSCTAFAKNWEAAISWEPACQASATVKTNALETQAFFERYFVPQKVQTQKDEPGLLTSYYEPELEVRAKPEPGFEEPVFARPDDLVTVDPKDFAATGFGGRKLMGRVEAGKLVPYYTRDEITKMGGKALAWGSPAEVFFLQVQGSGRLHFKDGRILRAGFAGHNGLAYTSIGRELIRDGSLEPGKASKGAIERWMKKVGSEKTRALLAKNKRYVFFAASPVVDKALGPVGTQGVPLTARASLAVDPAYFPLGTPIWVDTRLPVHDQDWKAEPIQFLAIAQDTGGAIKGPMRGDLFWGSGDAAGRRAGIVKHEARWWVLVPRSFAREGSGPDT
ncbi:MAG: murein transglycosylase [Robiginitomaculum sp.]|nr:MAG: murein transglycosylase [Robiginitomaculum sp.]